MSEELLSGYIHGDYEGPASDAYKSSSVNWFSLTRIVSSEGSQYNRHFSPVTCSCLHVRSGFAESISASSLCIQIDTKAEFLLLSGDFYFIFFPQRHLLLLNGLASLSYGFTLAFPLPLASLLHEVMQIFACSNMMTS